MTRRIADCLEVLDLIRSFAKHNPRWRTDEWRKKAIAHVASRGVKTETVYAHLVGKNTARTLDANHIDHLVSTWISSGSSELYDWLSQSCSGKDLERVNLFFKAQDATPIASDINDPEATERYLVNTYRVLRDTALARRIKSDMDYTCQICGSRIMLGDGSPYAEAHHVKPLGKPHNGPDDPHNIVCVCPNCHVKLDYGAIAADPVRLSNVLQEYIDYHNQAILQRKT